MGSRGTSRDWRLMFGQLSKHGLERHVAGLEADVWTAAFVLALLMALRGGEFVVEVDLIPPHYSGTLLQVCEVAVGGRRQRQRRQPAVGLLWPLALLQHANVPAGCVHVASRGIGGNDWEANFLGEFDELAIVGPVVHPWPRIFQEVSLLDETGKVLVEHSLQVALEHLEREGAFWPSRREQDE